MQRIPRFRVPCMAFVWFAAGCGAGSRPLVVFNAHIWTADTDKPAATVMVVGPDGRFCYVGDDLGEAKRLAGDRAEIRDVHGARILPGLIDAHLHLISGGLQLSRINLRDVPDRAAFIAAIAERAKNAPKGRWITGGRWSTESWPDPTQPTREWIDAVTPNHPVFLSRMDGHGGLANSVALKIAGITRDGPRDPVGGAIERDPKTGEPTGILKDAAMDLFDKHIPQPPPADLDAALVAAMHEANRYGVTCVHTMSAWRDLAPIERARRRGALSLRVRFYVSEDDWKPYLDKAKAFRSDDWLRICGFKQYADGSLGSWTAYMAEPFSDNPPDKPSWHGLLRTALQPDGGPANAKPLCKLCSEVNAAGFGCAVHAIGDQANHLVLDCYETCLAHQSAISNQQSEINRPHSRIEHAQHLLPADIQRFAKLGVIASMQPYHKADDGRYAEKAIGARRCETSYAFRSLRDAGAHIAFGSDWPVVSLNPFLGIHAAVTGRTLDGKTFVPRQNITVSQALHGYTTGAAYASNDELRLGHIRAGFLADFVILDRDILSTTPDELDKLRVVKTYVAGKVVWSDDLPKDAAY